MAFRILSAEKYGAKLKATIQQTGRLGFTETTAICLKLSAGRYAKFAQDEESKDLYLCMCEKKDKETFDVRLSGKYYYVPATTLFDMMGFDYKRKTIMFDLVRNSDLDMEMGGEVYKMNKRENLKRKE